MLLCHAKATVRLQPFGEPFTGKNRATFRAFKDEDIVCFYYPGLTLQGSGLSSHNKFLRFDGSKGCPGGFQNRSLPFWPRNFCPYRNHTVIPAQFSSHILIEQIPNPFVCQSAFQRDSTKANIPVSGFPRI